MRSTFEGFKEFAAEIERIEKVRQDLLVPMGKIKMVAPNTITLDRGEAFEEYGVTDNGHRQLAAKVGVPYDYYQRTATVPGLREYNVNAWLRETPSEQKLVRILDGNVRAILGPRFKPMDNFALMDAIAPALREVASRDELMVRTFALSENHMYLQVAFKKTMRELTPPPDPFKDGHYMKEPVRIMAGMTIRNSETGHAARDFRKMVWNLICWNGAISESVLRNYHVGRELESDDTGNIWTEETLRAEVELLRLKTRDIIRDAMDPASLNDFADKAQAAMENRITVPMDELIVNVTKRWGFSKAEGQLIMENILEGGQSNRTQWGLTNGINALAHVVDSVDRQYDLEKLSNDVISLSDKEWKAVAN